MPAPRQSLTSTNGPSTPPRSVGAAMAVLCTRTLPMRGESWLSQLQGFCFLWVPVTRFHLTRAADRPWRRIPAAPAYLTRCHQPISKKHHLSSVTTATNNFDLCGFMCVFSTRVSRWDPQTQIPVPLPCCSSCRFWGTRELFGFPVLSHPKLRSSLTFYQPAGHCAKDPEQRPAEGWDAAVQTQVQQKKKQIKSQDKEKIILKWSANAFFFFLSFSYSINHLIYVTENNKASQI